MSWHDTIRKSELLERSNRQGSDKPYGSYIETVSGDTEKAIIKNWATRGRELDLPHPFISTASWIRALPDRGAQYLTTSRADDPNPQLFSTVTKSSSERVDSYNKRLGVYRGLSEGEIEISSSGLSQSYYGSRAYSSSRAGSILRVMDQDNLSIVDRAPIHRKKLLNYESSKINDEYRLGIVSRPKNKWFNFYPKVNDKFMSEEYLHISNPAKSNPSSLVLSQKGNVVDLKGNVIKHKRTSLPLRLYQNYYAIDDTYTSKEIDQAGNYSLYLAQAAAEGMYIEIPNGNWRNRIKKDLNWDIDGSQSSIIKGSSSFDISGSLTKIINKAYKISSDSMSFISKNSTTVETKGYTLNSTDNYNISSTSSMSLESKSSLKIHGLSGSDIGSDSSITNVKGQLVNLAGGGLAIARVGDICVGIGNLGAPVISTIATGSPKVTSG